MKLLIEPFKGSIIEELDQANKTINDLMPWSHNILYLLLQNKNTNLKG
jgi:hypothetical protein